MLNGEGYTEGSFVFEMSRYGSFCWVNNEIIDNDVSGFLLRSKPVEANEGGIMTGIGAITPWKFHEK